MVRRLTVDHLVERAWSAPAWLRYGCGLALVLIDSILRPLLVPAFAGNLRLMTFFPAVILSAWLCGFGPGLLAILVSATAVAYWLPPPDSFRVASPHDIAALIIFSGVGVLIAGVIETLRRTRRRLAEESNNRAALAAERAQLIELEHRARMAAEAANRGKDEFLAMLAHELRTPLSAIATAAQTLERTRRDASMAMPIDVIARQTRHVTRLVDDLLDAGRVMAGKIQITCLPVDLADIVARSIEVLSAARKLDGHDLAVHVESAWIDADADRIEQVVVNLLGNAVKYTPPGGSITIRVQHDRADVVMTIEDDGIGIQPELLPRVFDLFVQGMQGRREGRAGLGIGLALVRRLVQLHGGTVQASTGGAGCGSIFTVRLPALTAPTHEPSFTSSSGSCYQRASLDLSGGSDVQTIWRGVRVDGAGWDPNLAGSIGHGTDGRDTRAQSTHRPGAT